jgi:RNA polymerase sigma factor (sigma-70 family)
MPNLPPFQRFAEEHRDAVWRFLVAAVGRSEAEDCFQETFVSALRAYPRLRSARNLRAWVLTIAHNKALDTHRRRAREPLAVAEVPERAVSSDNGDSDLWRAVRALPARQRTAIAHRFVSDLAYKDVAAAMSCSEDAARRSVHEGIKKLREVLR